MDTDLDNLPLSFRWTASDPETEAPERWYIRGIMPDGSFYGTIHIFEPGRPNSIDIAEGTLNPDTNYTLRALAQELLSWNTSDDTQGASAALGLGPLSTPVSVTYYSRSAEQSTERGQAFERFADILRKVLCD